MATREEKQKVVEENFRAFQELRPGIEKVYSGKFAVLRHGEIDEFFDSMADAVKYGDSKFPDGLYSVQQVTDRVVDLGYFSHARPVETL